jgi:energy-coupling factor transporter ATP-binding protein EcfA2
VSTQAVAGTAAVSQASAESIVDVRGLTVRYGRQLVLDAVSLSVPRGAVYALLGRNGVGKSSLVRCLLGLQRPDAGSARLCGRDAWRDRQPLMERSASCRGSRRAARAHRPGAPPSAAASTCAGTRPRSRPGSAAFGVPLGTLFRQLEGSGLP